jgi:hypothetical protein
MVEIRGEAGAPASAAAGKKAIDRERTVNSKREREWELFFMTYLLVQLFRDRANGDAISRIIKKGGLTTPF